MGGSISLKHPSLYISPDLILDETLSENPGLMKMKMVNMFTWGMGSDQYVSNVLLCISENLSLMKIKMTMKMKMKMKTMEMFTWGIGSALLATILRKGSPSPAARNALF